MGQFLSQQSAAKKAATISAHDRAVLDLKIQRDKLKQYQRQLQIVINREMEIARQHLQSGDKKRALLTVRKKRFQEQLIGRTEDQLINLETLTQSIEFALVEQQVLQGLKEGTRILQLLNREMRLDDVEKLMGDTEDAIAYQQEVETMLSGSNMAREDDAEELQRQLEELERLEVKAVESTMPAVPSTVLQSTPVNLSAKDSSVSEAAETKTVADKRSVLEAA